MAGGLYWQVNASVSQIARSVGDPSTSRSYFQPAAQWLREHGGEGVRVEVPPTANHWESAYLASQFELARGWLRQLDTTRDDIFYGDDVPLTTATYRHWLRQNAISYVALPDAPLDYSSVAERKLILSNPSYLDLRWSSSHWRIYTVRNPEPLVEPLGAAAAHVLWVGRQSFGLDVSRPGEFLVRVNFTPYWSISRGAGCLLRHGEWTVASASARRHLQGRRRLLPRPSLERRNGRPQDLLISVRELGRGALLGGSGCGPGTRRRRRRRGCGGRRRA